MNKKILSLAILAILSIGFTSIPTREAEASCCKKMIELLEAIKSNTGKTAGHAQNIELLLRTLIPNVLMNVGNKVSASVLSASKDEHALADAVNLANQQESIKDQDIATEKRYQKDEQACQIASTTMSVAYAEATSQEVAAAITDMQGEREGGSAGTPSAEGPIKDKEERVKVVFDRYCDPTEENGALAEKCNADGAYTNFDVDINKSVLSRSTIPMDDIGDLYALGNNLYGSTVNSPLSKTQLNTAEGQLLLQGKRAVRASRSIAKASYNAAVSKRMAPDVSDFAQSNSGTLTAILKALYPNDPGTIQKYLLDGAGASYYAQLEIMAKKQLQDPIFYVNFNQGPEMVTRQIAGIESIQTMVIWEILETLGRVDLNISQINEHLIADRQDRIESRIEALDR